MKRRIRKAIRYIIVLLGFLWLMSITYTVYLRWLPPITTHLMVSRGLEKRAEEKPEFHFRHKWRSWNNISDNAKLAAIAGEDANFAYHFGIDMEAIKKAIEYNSRGERVRGGSTISQQVAKNIFLWQGRSWLRKGLEVYFTWSIELLWSKERILQMYLNVAEMGDGIFGIEAAAQYYFGVRASELTAAQAASIAAVLPNPRKYNPKNPTKYIDQRKARILRYMRYLKKEKYLEKL
ncbi:MAG: monofunctional biosynthetic peptidoglycan transglycosylase [Bacteroidota bacterium]|nr:monofunctional biosynthetic peptidoglycan transglycosylase [Bacteroidota bacterium]